MKGQLCLDFSFWEKSLIKSNNCPMSVILGFSEEKDEKLWEKFFIYSKRQQKWCVFPQVLQGRESQTRDAGWSMPFSKKKNPSTQEKQICE